MPSSNLILLTEMETLTDQLRHKSYDFIREHIYPVLDWLEFEHVFEHWINGREKASIKSNYSDVLPGLTYHALTGDYEKSIPLCAAWMFYVFGAKVLDDIQDQDVEEEWTRGGLVKSIPLATTLITIPQLCLQCIDIDNSSLKDILGNFGMTSALASKMQSCPTNTYTDNSLEKYFEYIIATTANIFATGAWAGARLATNEKLVLDTLYSYGYGLGMRSAIILDCKDIAPQNKPSDLSLGHYKLPVLYAVSQTDHPHHEKFMTLLDDENLVDEKLQNVIQILDAMNAIQWSLNLSNEFAKDSRNILFNLNDQARERLTPYV